MKKLLLISITCLVASCSGKIYPLKFRQFDEPELNRSQTAELGERLALKGSEKYQDGLQITQMPESITINMVKYPYSVGDVLPLRESVKEWDLYYVGDATVSKTMYYCGIAKNHKDPSIVRPFLWYQYGLATKRTDNFQVKETTYTDSKCVDCFKQEFIYNGKVNNNLRFIYREYIMDMARPAFTQELQYDLSESSTIGFKGLRIDIEKATNTTITYKMLSSFTK